MLVFPTRKRGEMRSKADFLTTDAIELDRYCDPKSEANSRLIATVTRTVKSIAAELNLMLRVHKPTGNCGWICLQGDWRLVAHDPKAPFLLCDLLSGSYNFGSSVSLPAARFFAEEIRRAGGLKRWIASARKHVQYHIKFYYLDGGRVGNRMFRKDVSRLLRETRGKEEQDAPTSHTSQMDFDDAYVYARLSEPTGFCNPMKIKLAMEDDE